jgi:hypothetical protein
MAAGITLSCAISTGQFGGCSCGGCGGLLAASDCCRLLCSTASRLRAKSIAHTHSGRFADAGLHSKPQCDSYTDPEISDENHSQSNADPDSNSNRHSDPNASGLSRYECHTNAHTCACVPLTVFSVLPFLKGIEACRPQKQNPPVLLAGSD